MGQELSQQHNVTSVPFFIATTQLLCLVLRHQRHSLMCSTKPSDELDQIDFNVCVGDLHDRCRNDALRKYRVFHEDHAAVSALHKELVILSGVFEIFLGLLLLVPRCSRLAALGIIALLIAVFPANIYLYQHEDILPASPIIHLLRLPLQGVVILWAFWHTRATKKDNDALTRIIHEWWNS